MRNPNFKQQMQVPFVPARLILPAKDQIILERDNSNGQISIQLSREMPFPEVAMILSQMAATICQSGLAQLVKHFNGSSSEPRVAQNAEHPAGAE